MNNVKKIQQELRRRGLDGVLVTDEKNQLYASGFPIMDGAVVVRGRGEVMAHNGLALYRGRRSRCGRKFHRGRPL